MSSKSPKVSIVVSDLSGGGAIRAYLLGQVFQQLQYRVEVVGFLCGQELFAAPPKEMPVVAVPGGDYPGFYQAARQLLAQMDGDILCAVKPKPTSFGLALLKKWQTRRPLLLDMDDWEMSWHGGDSWQYRPSLRQLYHHIATPGGQLRQPDHPLYVKWLEGWVNRADALTIDTQFLHDRFGGTYLPNGKDTDLFDPACYDAHASRERYGLANYRVLMFPGAPRPHKGVEDVLAALELLNEPDLRVVIIGGSPYDDYDAQLQAKWGRWIIQLPKQPVEKMPEVVAAAHVVVVPQRDTLTARAQFPLKLTDGMAMAKPVLSTRVGDIPNILAETGYLADPSAPEQLAEQIRRIFQYPDEAMAKGLRARQRCVELYSVQAMGNMLAEALAGIKI